MHAPQVIAIVILTSEFFCAGAIHSVKKTEETQKKCVQALIHIAVWFPLLWWGGFFK